MYQGMYSPNQATKSPQTKQSKSVIVKASPQNKTNRKLNRPGREVSPFNNNQYHTPERSLRESKIGRNHGDQITESQSEIYQRRTIDELASEYKQKAQAKQLKLVQSPAIQKSPSQDLERKQEKEKEGKEKEGKKEEKDQKKNDQKKGSNAVMVGMVVLVLALLIGIASDALYFQMIFEF